MIVVVHNGSMHPDDVCSVALVKLDHENLQVIRSRNPEDWESADLVLDVGKKFDGKKYFDHHQENVPTYENGIRKAACGLYLDSMNLTEQEKNYLLSQGLFAVQAQDNGQNLNDLGLDFLVNPFSFVYTFNQDWKTGVYGSEQDKAFMDAVDIAFRVIKNLLNEAKFAKLAQEQTAKAIEKIENHIVVIGNYCPHMNQIIEYNGGKPNILITVYKNSQGQWNVQAVPKQQGNFETWIDIPESVSTLSGFVFRHKNAFLAGFDNKDSAMKAALLSVHG